MSDDVAPPPWLAELQRRFGAVLRAPLDRSTGTLRAVVTAYDRDAVDEALDGPRAPAGERLAVYNRQYWFRLFRTVQTAFPVTTRLLGHWRTNDYAARFFLAHPPTSWDLDRAPDGFEAFLAEALVGDVVCEPVCEAARLDAAWRALFLAPVATPFQPSAADAARLLDARLAPSPSTVVFVERWPLLALKGTLATIPGEAPVPVPDAHPQPHGWALVREAAGIRHVPLDAREHELFGLLREHSVRDALARLEAVCPEAERAALPAKAQRWLARSAAFGFWSGIDVG